jgi:hypothetical protein
VEAPALPLREVAAAVVELESEAEPAQRQQASQAACPDRHRR